MRRTVLSFFVVLLAAYAAEPQAFSPQRWRLGKPFSHQQLKIYPVTTDQNWDASGYLTLDEGVAAGKVQVTELPSAQVNRLSIVNRSDRPLLLLAGEIITGGKQDRMISEDRIIPPGGAPTTVDVYCVEPGRWHGRQDQFDALKAMVNPAVREQAIASKSQDGVWSRGRQASARLVDHASEHRPASTSYAQVYRAPAAESSLVNPTAMLKAQYEDALRSNLKGKQVVGMLVEIQGQPVWADVFASPALFQKYWPKLLSSYVIEALARPAPRANAPAVTPEQFLQRLDAGSKIERQDRAHELTRGESGATLTYQLSGRSAGKQAPVHFTRFQRE